MLVGVHMIEKQAGGAKCLELRADLRCELTANLWQSEKPHAGSAHIRVEAAVPAHQTGNFGAGKGRKPINEHQMQADPQVRQATGTSYRIGDGWSADHQARGRQKSVPVSLFDSCVDGGIEPEIVRADDQAPQSL